MQIFNKLLRLQKVYIFFISFVLFIIIFSTTLLYANAFTVSNIQISSPFELNFKKSSVIDKGFHTSFLDLLSMITTSSDKNRVKYVPIKELKGMIDSFTISDEKFINNEYFAKLETTFNKKKILNFLEKNIINRTNEIKNIYTFCNFNNLLIICIFYTNEKRKIYL